MQVYAAGLARALGMPDTEIQGVKTAALLHDIGKLAVPEHILSKPGPLTQEEFQKIRIHPQVGAEIIAGVPFPYPVAPLILSHHERWDGKGYPQGLEGRGDSARRAHPDDRRLLRRAHVGAAVSQGAERTRAPIGLLRQEAGQGARPDARRRCSSSCCRRCIAEADAAERADAAVAAPTARTAGRARRRPASLPEPRSRTSFEDIALAHREIYALYEIAQAMGTQPRRRPTRWRSSRRS